MDNRQTFLVFLAISFAVVGSYYLWNAKPEIKNDSKNISITDNFNSPSINESKAILFKDNFTGPLSPEWQLMRMQFEVNDGKLQVVSAPRPGFLYGHTGHGRSAAAFVHIGDHNWKDYRLEMDVFGGGVGAFNPHGISPCMRGGFRIFFRTQDYKENWNEPGRTGYALGLNPMPKLCDGKDAPDGTLERINNWYSATPQGWCGGIARNYFIAPNGLSPAVTDDIETFWNELIRKGYLDNSGRILDRISSTADPLAMDLDPRYSQDLPIIYKILKANYCSIPGGSKTLLNFDGNLWHIDEPNHVVIDVVGRSIKININGQQAVNYEDYDPNALLYGGIGVMWEWDNTGWISNVKVTQL